MRLFRYGDPGHERPGAWDTEGIRRDLSGLVGELDGNALRVEMLAELAAQDLARLPVVAQDVRIGPCLAGVRNFICVGLNYVDHALESGFQPPTEPVLFNKAPSCIGGPNDDVLLPPGSEKMDWEVELAVVMGARAYGVTALEAPTLIAGYTICNDISERAFQLELGGQWIKGKSSPGFGPLGPWLATPDELPDPSSLGIWLKVNGESRQSANTADMIFDVNTLIAYISRFMILEPGDVIATGTPPGVGLGMRPPQYLKAGDVVELGIDRLGTQKQRIV